MNRGKERILVDEKEGILAMASMPMIGTEEKREREFNKVKRSVESWYYTLTLSVI